MKREEPRSLKNPEQPTNRVAWEAVLLGVVSVLAGSSGILGIISGFIALGVGFLLAGVVFFGWSCFVRSWFFKPKR